MSLNFHSLLSWLDYPLKRCPYYSAAFLLSVIYTLHVFPLAFLLGNSGFWFNTYTDPTQHISGFWAFANDEWRFPLLHTTLLNAPDGVSVAFTDSIPLMAILAKPIYPLLPQGSHYMGLWVFVCYVAQGLAGAWGASVIGKRSPVALLAGTLFAVMMPSLMIRLPHGALLAQFTLLVALVLYYRVHRRQMTLVAFGLGSTGLLLFVAGIHPYLLAMLYALYATTLLSVAWREWNLRTMLFVVTWCILPLPLLLLTLYSFGYLAGTGLPPAENGYTDSSMNLLSPWLGTHLATSRFLPAEGIVLDATGMQIDGHNYLGLGLILALCGITLGRPGKTLEFLKAHWIMALLLTGLIIYSLSNKIYLANHVVLHYPLPRLIEPLTQIFRGSGRFFWPVGYALLLIVLRFFLTQSDPRFRVALLALLALQYADTLNHREYLVESANREPVFAYDHDLWNERIGQASSVYLLPTYGCGASNSDANFLQYFTALHAVPFNSGFVARVSSDCKAKEKVLDAERQPGEVFIFASEHYTFEQLSVTMGGHNERWCRQEDIGIVCIVDK